MAETKRIKYKCRNCGYEQTEEFAFQALAPITQKCPECNKMQLDQVIPTYFEQMKDKLKSDS